MVVEQFKYVRRKNWIITIILSNKNFIELCHVLVSIKELTSPVN